MKTVDPSIAHIAQFERDTPDANPIVMVNLLKFRDVANYSAPDGARVLTGRDAYRRYSKAVVPLVFEVGGQPMWMGSARSTVIAPDEESWDEVVLVHYPSRQAFLRMIKSKAYQSIVHHRTAALIDSRLVETRALPLPPWKIGIARTAVRMKALLFPKVA